MLQGTVPSCSSMPQPFLWLEVALSAVLEQKKQGAFIALIQKEEGLHPCCCCSFFPRCALEQLLFLSPQLPPDLLHQPADT